VDQSPGLSTYLSGDLPLENVIQELLVPNVSLLAAGAVPSNPSELLSSNRMRDLLHTLAERYDHILVDSPPLINFADPLILSAKVDGVILVISGGKTTLQEALRARDDLLTVGANAFGVVMNNFEIKNEGYGYYSHSN
jgi:capsular exopolysaccharide synthesis family protein